MIVDIELFQEDSSKEAIIIEVNEDFP